MKTVLITGGNGFLGANLALRMTKEGFQVRLLSRGTHMNPSLQNVPVEQFIGDIQDLSAVRKAVKGIDVVIHTAAKVSYWGKEYEEMHAINVGGTQNMIEAALEAGIEKFIHISSIAAVGSYSELRKPTDEDAPDRDPRYSTGYGRTKLRSERLVREALRHGLPAVILNPSVMVGEHDRQFLTGRLIRDVVRGRMIAYPGGGTNIVYVQDVVSSVIKSISHGRIGERYILSGNNVSFKQLFTEIADITSSVRPLFPIPPTAVKMVSMISEIYATLTDTKPWLPRDLARGAGVFRYYSSKKAERELDHPVTAISTTIRNTYLWYKSNGFL